MFTIFLIVIICIAIIFLSNDSNISYPPPPSPTQADPIQAALAYQEGYLAECNGLLLEDNPYKSNHPVLEAAWNEGYNDSEDEEAHS